MDFATIKTEVEDWVLDLPTGLQVKVGTFANEAIKAAAKRYNFRFMEGKVATSPLSTTDQQRLLVVKPSDWKENRGLPYEIHQDGTTDELDWAGSKSNMVRTHYAEQLPSESNTTPADEGHPRYLEETADDINVWPLPDNDSTWDNGLYRIVVPYWKYPATLVGDNDTNFLTENAEFYVIWKALSIAFGFNRDEERMTFWEKKAERQFKIIERQDKLSKLPDRMTLRVSKDVYAGRSRRGLRG